MKSHCRVILAMFALSVSACESTPAGPDATTIPPALLQIVGWNFGTSTTTARVNAHWIGREPSLVDVTTLAAWDSSAPGVLAVVGPGRLIAVASGEADLHVTYRGAVASRYFRVFAGEPPWPAYRAGDPVTIGDVVRDARTPSSTNGIDSVRIEVIGGHNTGCVVTTDATGRYTLHPPFVCGPVTMRATKAGYQTATASSVMCQNGMPRILMTPES